MLCQALIFRLGYFREKIKYMSRAHLHASTKKRQNIILQNMYLCLMNFPGQEWQHFFPCNFPATVRTLRDSASLSLCMPPLGAAPCCSWRQCETQESAGSSPWRAPGWRNDEALLRLLLPGRKREVPEIPQELCTQEKRWSFEANLALN